MKYVINRNYDTFELTIDGEIMASAMYYWEKMPVVINGIVDDSLKEVKQIYITDVKSFKEGSGSILMEEIIKYFKQQSLNISRRGYNKNAIWLKVLEDNIRAIYLYKKFNFNTFDKGYCKEYLRMYCNL